jgi:hypothetical protein
MNKYSLDDPLHKREGLIDLLATRQSNKDGWFNPCFENEPTNTDIMIMLMKIDANCERNKQRIDNQYNQVKNGGDMCCLATLSLDQKISVNSVLQSITDIIETLQTTQYKWYCDPILRAEFFTGKENKWNPHIHILNRRSIENGVAPSVIKQALKKKLKDEKYNIYRFDAQPRPLEAGEQYISGIKRDTKQENVKKDEEFRKNHGISDIIYL